MNPCAINAGAINAGAPPQGHQGMVGRGRYECDV
jgi:hypothetical protein